MEPLAYLLYLTITSEPSSLRLTDQSEHQRGRLPRVKAWMPTVYWILALALSWPSLAQGVSLGQLDQGPEVANLQMRLKQLGFFDGPVTGYFGPLTQDAVTQFQTAKGLVVDGIVGAETQAALNQAIVPSSSSTPSPTVARSTTPSPPPKRLTAAPKTPIAPLRRGDSGDRVSQLQTTLAQLNHYDGPITGYFGELTEAAVTHFQQLKGLTADGVVGTETLSALSQEAKPPKVPDQASSQLNPQPLTLSPSSPQPSKAPASQPQPAIAEPAPSNPPPFNSQPFAITNARPTTTAPANPGASTALDFESNTIRSPGQPTPLGASPVQPVGSPSPPLSPEPSASATSGTESDHPLNLSPTSPAPLTPTPSQGTPSSPASLGKVSKITEPLTEEDSGESVRTLQSLLIDRGYYQGPTTGYFGPLTRDALIGFQQDQGLQADGVAGKDTVAALQQAPPNSAGVQTASAPALTVLEVQQRLQARGFNPGPVDGVMGAQTRSALAEAQQVYGINYRIKPE